MSTELSEQEVIRRNSLTQLRELGIDPYPAEEFIINATAEDILKNYQDNQESYQNISIAGRIMTRRIMGSAAFVEIQDATGRIQVYLKRDELCPDEDKTLYNIVFKKLMDLGDFIGIQGYAFVTQTGEISIHVRSFKILSKSLRPLPVVKRRTTARRGASVCSSPALAAGLGAAWPISCKIATTCG